ncbi:hypothetical protein ACQKII_21990 [Lysinibacillus sp. NPDC048646]|uniref:hypothetical protein n=1 Tax=Lysinibacillus sp. NPDC048646 TaxID=3390574 RepID=UPI003D004D8A
MALAPLTIERAYMTFLFPFAYHMQCRDQLCIELTKENFSFFTLQNKSLEDDFYGESISI